MAAIISSCCTFGASAAVSYTPGDVNGDGRVNLQDVVLMTRWSAGWKITINEANADVNGDNTVTLMDAALVMRHLAGGWDIILGQYTITFDAQSNGGTFTTGNGYNADATKKLVPGSTFGSADPDGHAWPKNPKKYGCTFKGWYTAKTGGTRVESTTVFEKNQNIVLYAQFGNYMETPEIGI